MKYTSIKESKQECAENSVLQPCHCKINRSEFQSDFDKKVGTQQTKYNLLYSAVVAYVQNNSLINVLMTLEQI